jgi:hypothetical protein
MKTGMILSLLGWVMMGCITVSCLSGYGRQWDLSGKYHLPTTLLAPNGKTYRDGSRIDDVTKALVDSGIEQEVELVLVVVILVFGMALQVRMRHSYRMQMKEIDRALRRNYGMPPRHERRK